MTEHFCGVYRGLVMDIADPESRGRIKVQIPQIFGDLVLPYWAWPVNPGLVPTLGMGAFVMFEAGDPDKPVWIGTF